MATATEPKVFGMSVEERLKKIEEAIDRAKVALKNGDIKEMNTLLLKAYTLGSGF
jgi:hypothetical protein